MHAGIMCSVMHECWHIMYIGLYMYSMCIYRLRSVCMLCYAIVLECSPCTRGHPYIIIL